MCDFATKITRLQLIINGFIIGNINQDDIAIMEDKFVRLAYGSPKWREDLSEEEKKSQWKMLVIDPESQTDDSFPKPYSLDPYLPITFSIDFSKYYPVRSNELYCVEHIEQDLIFLRNQGLC